MKDSLFYLKFILSVLPALVFMLSVFLTNLEAPWRTVNEDNGYIFGSFARSHLVLGLGKTLGQDFFYNGPDQEPKPYLHHPPATALTLSIFMKLFNSGNLDEAYWQERLMPIVFHSASFVLITLLCYSFFNSFKSLLVSSWVFVLAPMSLYYGRMVSSEPPTLFFLILTAAVYIKYNKEIKSAKRYLFLLPLLFFSFYDWVGFYFIPVVLFLDIFSYGEKMLSEKKYIFNLILFEILILLLIFGQIFMAGKNSLQALEESLLQRISVDNGSGLIKSSLKWVGLMAERYVIFFTPLISIPPSFYIVRLFSKRSLDWLSWQKMVVIIFLVAVIHVILFPNGASNHFFWQIYFLPALVITSAYLWSKFGNFLAAKTRPALQKPFLTAYFIILFLILIMESRPVVTKLYTGEGKYLFPHFYIANRR